MNTDHRRGFRPSSVVLLWWDLQPRPWFCLILIRFIIPGMKNAIQTPERENLRENRTAGSSTRNFV